MKLFARIFFSFWVMIIVLGVMSYAWALMTVAVIHRARPRILPIFPVRVCGFAVLDEYQRAGTNGLAQYLAKSRTNCDTGGTFVFRGRQFLDMPARVALVESAPAQEGPQNGSVAITELPFHLIKAVPGKTAQDAPGFIVLLHSHFVFFLNSPWPLRALLAFLVSRFILLALLTGLCCYALTLYLVKPLMRLGRVAEQLGGGDLAARIEGPLVTRGDELGEFSRKFNQMAGEIESLVTRYKHFLAHASHELGSPLTRVNIALGLVKKRADLGLQPELSRIAVETKRLNILVRELLLLARLESGNELAGQTTSFHIASVIDEACADATFEAADMGKSIRVHKRGNFHIAGHPELLRRALDNVLRNSLRFARENVVVTVDLAHNSEENTGIISIEDDGPGIRPDQREMIFEPFVRLPNPARDESEGSGLGLAIARQAIRANGGLISAQAREAGGLMVSIELPITE